MSENGTAGGGKRHEPKIYFLPNLFTAANLFCGFLALTIIVSAPSLYAEDTFDEAKLKVFWALKLILLACFFDALDGRVARMGGYESPFGREFDSLADIVSFGLVPAFLVHRVVLSDVFVAMPETGWFIASVYVICGALRLARFNCIAASEEASGEHSREFVGFPIPAAAGLVASITYFLIWMEEKEFAKGNWKYALPVLLVFLSAMMVSHVAYPTFKRIDWRAPRSFMKMVFAAMLVGFLFTVGRRYLPVVMPLIFITYLVYGFVRPFISRRMRRDIEEDLEATES
jgi:CDP-diacylglycerol--serine O-phosphatidyltransferase